MKSLVRCDHILNGFAPLLQKLHNQARQTEDGVPSGFEHVGARFERVCKSFTFGLRLEKFSVCKSTLWSTLAYLSVSFPALKINYYLLDQFSISNEIIYFIFECYSCTFYCQDGLDLTHVCKLILN